MKHLIFLAGPHRSDGKEVNYFFHKYATSSNENGLKGWLWPEIEEELPGEKHEYFENLFWNHNNSTIQDVLMQGIKSAWEQSMYGVIVGAEGFDNTRGAPDSMGLKTMNKIIDSLGVQAQHVYVVMMYKTPRLDQWVNLFRGNSDGDYHNFVCNEEYSEHLANIDMNPFMLSAVFRAQGWNVATVDTTGAEMKGQDASHSIACELMPLVQCENGWIRELQNQTTEREIVNLQEFKALPPQKMNELEGMFLARDCHYRNLLQSDDSFFAINKERIWNECEDSDYAQGRYEQLTDPKYFFDLMKTQVGCSQSPGPVSLPGPHDYDPSLDAGLSTIEDSFEWNGIAVAVLVLAIVAFLYTIYSIVARSKRRQTRTVRSPKQNWIDFTDEAFNLQSPSKEDEDGSIAFDDVDLKSPALNKKEAAVKTPEAPSALVVTARQGISVRGVYEVGRYQDSPTIKLRPQKGDSELEHEIKNLEAEFV